MSIGNYPKSLSPAMLLGTMLVGGLGVGYAQIRSKHPEEQAPCMYITFTCTQHLIVILIITIIVQTKNIMLTSSSNATITMIISLSIIMTSSNNNSNNNNNNKQPIISPPYKKSPLIRNPPLGGFLFYYQFRPRHDFPPHKIPPLGGKYCHYQFRRRHYQFRWRQRSHFVRGGFLLGGEMNNKGGD